MALTGKSRILDKIEKLWTKMSCSTSWRADKCCLENGQVGSRMLASVQLKRAKARAKIQRHVSLF
jgi:hypothetical protein